MKILKTFILLLLFLQFAGSLSAQDITEAEYYFDTDPGQGNGTSFSLVQNNGEYSYSGNLNTSSLSRGIHVLYIREKNDEGEWGLPVEQMIVVNTETGGETGSLEYFYAEDPGQGEGNALSVNGDEAIELPAGISTAEISPGVHQLSIRAGNGEGTWGMPVEHLVYVSKTAPDGSAFLSMAEYFTESDPGFSEATEINLSWNGDEYTAEFTVAGTDFTIGKQQLFVRTGDENGVWGLYAPLTFLTSEVPDLVFENVDTLQYEMNSGLLFFAENLTVSSETNITADSALIQMTEGYLPEEDSLGVEDAGFLEVTSGPSWIRLSGNDDLDDYEEVLQTAYLTAFEAETYSDTLKRFEIKIWKGAFASDPVVKYVSVSYSDTTTTSAKEPGALPDSYSLSPNYPNPFNPVTSVRFSLPEPAEVKLTIFNMLGQEVAVLVNEKKNAGWYTVQIDANSWASGLYIYRLQAGGFLKSGKMTLIK